ncbi:hypothetical protein [Rodentibacter caecimuris]|uniref:hypothetical protein n=1 Tax=Rodentibacter caecimuris TaxID=1796644 RepID=UPI0039906E9F
MKFFPIILTLFLASCVSAPKIKYLPEQNKNIRLFKVETAGQASLLSIQFEKEQWYWLQTDPLGAPLARMILDIKGWRNDGFIAPNNQAKQLFTALAVGLNPNNPPFELDDHWEIRKTKSAFEIRLPDTSVWHIDEL